MSIVQVQHDLQYKFKITHGKVHFIFCRKIPLLEVNIISFLISYSIELVNSSISLVCFTMIFVICIHPWPFILAQVYLITYNALGCIICAVGATISCLQILYFIEFGLVFSWNPIHVGRVTLFIVLMVTGIPNLISGLYTLNQGIPLGPTVYFLTQAQIKQSSQSTSFFLVHLACWAIICVSLFFLAFFVIPLVMKYGKPGPE